MSQFWLWGALLLVVAIGFIWLPIIRYRKQIKLTQSQSTVSSREVNLQAYRSRLQELEDDLVEGRIEPAELESLKLELERTLLADATGEQAELPDTGGQARHSGTGWVLGSILSISLLSGTGILYWQLGSAPTLLQMEQHQAMFEKMSAMTPEQRLVMLREQAEAEPDKAEIWYALARGYLQTEKYQRAREAYDRVLLLVGEDPQVLAEYAQSLFLVNGNRMDDEVRALIDRAIAVDPVNDTALGLLGIDAFDRKQYAQAINYWQQIIDAMSPGEEVRAITAGIERAKQLLEQQTGNAAAVPQTDQQTEASLLIKVSLSEDLKKNALPEETVFIYARAFKGPAMPLAAVKLQVRDLPAEVVLNDQMAMAPQARLSQFEQVQVVARISRSQSVAAAAGDLQGESAPINLADTATSINILIDNIVE